MICLTDLGSETTTNGELPLQKANMGPYFFFIPARNFITKGAFGWYKWPTTGNGMALGMCLIFHNSVKN